MYAWRLVTPFCFSITTTSNAIGPFTMISEQPLPLQELEWPKQLAQGVAPRSRLFSEYSRKISCFLLLSACSSISRCSCSRRTCLSRSIRAAFSASDSQAAKDIRVERKRSRAGVYFIGSNLTGFRYCAC